ncbi:MAG TPA: hypothetical protein VJB59_15790 [Bdellovibrionota bacterium]|nr:hypothetical protein [Bdellovibrionota bacterium]
MNEIDPLLRKAIKMLLLQLAARTENPAHHLDHVLREVIQELYVESKNALEEKKSHLRLVVPAVAAEG